MWQYKTKLTLTIIICQLKIWVVKNNMIFRHVAKHQLDRKNTDWLRCYSVGFFKTFNLAQIYPSVHWLDRTFIYTRWPRQPKLISTRGVCQKIE
jgi:hypothetical protein